VGSSWIQFEDAQRESVYSTAQCVAAFGSALQCVATCLRLLHGVAVYCNVLQCIFVCRSVFYHITVYCRVVKCVAVRCSVLQCVAVCGSVLQCVVVCCSASSIYQYIDGHRHP